jgi:hypothetical protein
MNNTINNETLAMNNVIKRSVLPTRTDRKQRHCSLLIAHCSLVLLIVHLISCDLFTGPKEDLFKKISDDVDYANAPWVPLHIQPGNMGTSNPMGIQNKTVKKGYSFTLVFQPYSQYPFKGWRAWIEGEGLKASWRNDDQDNPFGTEWVRFEPRNAEGTEVKIFVYQMPPDGKRLVIGPWGADAGELSIAPVSGNLGNIFPAVLNGIKQGFPFTVSFQPSPAYPFRGWEASVNGEVFSSWKFEGGKIVVEGGGIEWSPMNVSGLEISVTINDLPSGASANDTVFIGPIGWDSAALDVRMETGGLGTAASSLTAAPARAGFPFTVSFQPDSRYPFMGWRVWVETDGVWAYWKPDGVYGEERVTFAPRNAEGTEVEITVKKADIAEEGTIYIGPLGGDRDELTVLPQAGRLGTIYPATLSGIKEGFPFTISFQPLAAYEFRGWQAELGDGTVLSSWRVENGQPVTEGGGVIWEPRNAAGLEMSVTITGLAQGFSGAIVIGPLGRDSPRLTVDVKGGGLGTAATAVTTETPARLGYPFTVSFQPSTAYPFCGWEASVNGKVFSSWRFDGIEIAVEGEGIEWMPLNVSGLEMSVIIVNPLKGMSDTDIIVIGPIGWDSAVLDVKINTGGLGTAVSSVAAAPARAGFPFTVSFQPSSAYPFRGWQLTFNDGRALIWKDGEGIKPEKHVSWSPVNVSGLEMSITINELPEGLSASDTILIGPVDWDSAVLNVQINTGGLGTYTSSLTAAPARMGFPFTVSFQPDSRYPFQGWRLWAEGEGVLAYWKPDGAFGEDAASFVPRGADGTEVEITVHSQAASGKQLVISPLGVDSGDLIVVPNAGGLGSIYPAVLEGVKMGYPFTVSFQPSAAYPFHGWQIRAVNTAYSTWTENGVVSQSGWQASWSKKNPSGTEMEITIEALPEGMGAEASPLTIMPVGGESGNAVVRMAVPEGWGTSTPPAGPLNGIRRTFPFTVEFTPSTAWAFVEWRAYKESDYHGAATTAQPLPSSAVLIGDINGGKSTVTVNSGDAIVLAPFCYERPRLDQQTNPPINPILTPFPFNQDVNIRFTKPVKASTLTWANIAVTGIYASGNNRGQFFNGNGDLTAYFRLEIPADSDRRVNLVPKPETAAELALLSISVTVGPGIESSNGVTMAQAETVSYQTDTREAQKAYRANGVSASRSAASGYWTDTDYSNPDKDRRFKQTDKNTVYIRFSVDPPSGEGIPSTPNKIRIVESRAYDLRGFNASGAREKEYDYPGTGVTLLNGMFTIEHTLQTGDSNGTSGILQLIILPSYSGAPNIEAMPENEAVSEGRYVTLVMDNAAPDAPDLRPGLSAPSSKDGETYVYGPSTVMTLTLAGLAGVADNGGEGGIPASRAYSLPWTMEEPQKMSWYAQIGTNDQVDDTGINTLNSLWQGVYKNDGITLNNTWTLTDLSGLTPGVTYPIWVKFKDSLGNVSGWNKTALSVKYSTATIETVTNIRAECNTAGNQITVSWDETGTGWTGASGTYPYPEVVITTYRASTAGDIEESTAAVTQNRNVKTYSFTAPKINDTAVRDGTAVSGVYGYKISMITHNITGDAAAAPVWIYNIPDMKTALAAITTGGKTYSPTVRITSVSDAHDAANRTVGLKNVSGVLSTYTNFVLTSDISLSAAWTPVGTGAASFQGKFYGNGHTVTFDTGSSFANVAYTGLFGYVSGSAIIRDLSVNYAVNLTAGASSTNMGGIAGRIDGNAVIRNTIVKGTGTGKLNITQPTTSAIYAGSIAGYMQATTLIENCFTNIELSATATATSTTTSYKLCAGGVAGYIDTTSVAVTQLMINGVKAAGTVEGKTNNTSVSAPLYIGGAVGECQGKGKIEDAEVSGTVRMLVNTTGATTATPTYLYVCGGVIGKMQNGNLESCDFTGKIDLPSTPSPGYTATGTTYIGGLTGITGTLLLSDPSASNPNANTSPINVVNSSASGDLKLNTSGDGKFCIGGISAGAYGGTKAASLLITFTNCEYRNGEISFTRSSTSTSAGSQNIGGFCADIISNVSFKNCRSNAGLISVDTKADTGIDGASIGGFAGILRGSASGCYSKSPIEVILTLNGSASAASTDTNLNIGGFAGFSEYTNWYGVPPGSGSAWTIDTCYAAGSIYVLAASSRVTTVFVGGFVGGIEHNVTVRDCYALGNVTVDRNGTASSNETIYAGGFAGRLRPKTSGTPKITACFSKGIVAMQANRDVAGEYLYVGGIAGYIESGGAVNNCVALAPSYTLLSGSSCTRGIGRISGNASGLSNNFACATQLYDGVYGSLNPSPGGSLGSGSTHKDGIDVSSGTYGYQSFWTNTTAGSGPGFGTSQWSFTGISSRGYPLLVGVGGQ